MGKKIEGLLPSMQDEVAFIAGEWSQQILSIEKIEEFLLSNESKIEIHSYLEKKADDFIRYKLTERISLLKMFITEGIIVQAKDVLVEELDKMIPELMKAFAPKVSEKINIKEAIEFKIKNYPLQNLEKQIYKIAYKKILAIKIFIASIGFLVGFLEISFFIIS